MRRVRARALDPFSLGDWPRPTLRKSIKNGSHTRRVQRYTVVIIMLMRRYHRGRNNNYNNSNNIIIMKLLT